MFDSHNSSRYCVDLSINDLFKLDGFDYINVFFCYIENEQVVLLQSIFCQSTTEYEMNLIASTTSNILNINYIYSHDSLYLNYI